MLDAPDRDQMLGNTLYIRDTSLFSIVSYLISCSVTVVRFSVQAPEVHVGKT